MYSKIGKVAMQVGLSIKRIREYEKEGFLRPHRCESSNQRLYGEFEIQQILQIKKLIHERGMTVEGIRYLLNLAPCWLLFGCKNAERCQAFNQPHERCWQVAKALDLEPGCPGDCNICPVFLSRGAEIRPLFEKTPSDNGDGNAAEEAGQLRAIGQD